MAGRKRYTDEEKDKMLKHVKDGMSVTEAAERHGVSYASLLKWAKDAGLVEGRGSSKGKGAGSGPSGRKSASTLQAENDKLRALLMENLPEPKSSTWQKDITNLWMESGAPQQFEDDRHALEWLVVTHLGLDPDHFDAAEIRNSMLDMQLA